MRRREFIKLLGGTAAAWPVTGLAQQSKPRIGMVSMGADPSNPVLFTPFLLQMRELGYIEGDNIVFEKRFAAGNEELINDFVADLVRQQVDIIVVTGQRESIAAARATSTIPIVTIVTPDPIAMGAAQSLSKPGGNLTGLTTMDFGMYGKRIELLKQVPSLNKAGLIVSQGNPTFKAKSDWARDVEAAARSLGVSLDIITFPGDAVAGAVAAAVAGGSQGLIGASDGVIVGRRKEIVRLQSDTSCRRSLRCDKMWKLAD